MPLFSYTALLVFAWAKEKPRRSGAKRWLIALPPDSNKKSRVGQRGEAVIATAILAIIMALQTILLCRVPMSASPFGNIGHAKASKTSEESVQ